MSNSYQWECMIKEFLKLQIDTENVKETIENFERNVKTLAQSQSARKACTSIEQQSLDYIVVSVTNLWFETLTSLRHGKWSKEVEFSVEKSILSARCVRNAVVENPQGQEGLRGIIKRVLELPILEKEILSDLKITSSNNALLRTIIQSLANLTTDNDSVIAYFWLLAKEFLLKPDKVATIQQLLQASDFQIRTATLVLLQNCLFKDSLRCEDFIHSSAGISLLKEILSLASSIVDIEEIEKEEGKEVEELLKRFRIHAFEIIVHISSSIFSNGFFDLAFDALKDEKEIINDAQITLLKLLDSHLESSSIDGIRSLTSIFVRLTNAAVLAMQNNGIENNQILIKLHSGLILVLQCLNTVVLQTEKLQEQYLNLNEEILMKMRKEDFLEILLLLLRTVSSFSSIISPFQSQAKNNSVPEGHILSSTGKAENDDTQLDQPRMDNLKRDIINLISTIVYDRNRPGEKESIVKVQNFMVNSNGILTILENTQLDQRNQYIRERSIFCLKNLLKGNVSAQSFVDKIKPIEN